MHIVFSTKERRKIIPTQMKERLYAYTAGICQHQNVFVHAIGGMEDHIHMLLQFPATVAIADAIWEIKANSSRWMEQKRPQQKEFARRHLYGCDWMYVIRDCKLTMNRRLVNAHMVFRYFERAIWKKLISTYR
jgi:REP element-mobilizing transposase RayT